MQPQQRIIAKSDDQIDPDCCTLPPKELGAHEIRGKLLAYIFDSALHCKRVLRALQPV